ncbi:MAG TPA: LptF/LptG family permease [Gemmatimonadaceae bacterium]|nr:LptF/LptG family permease [Gemmatimonadaceae bacterium]
MRHAMRTLDRYVLREFWRILITTALGFPLLVIVIDLTDNLDKYLARNLPPAQIALSYVFWIPDSMFMVLPAAVLFATVFTVGALTRHSEVTAAKASGTSFHRMVAPIFLGAGIVTIATMVLGELVPVTNARRSELLREKSAVSKQTTRFNFAFAAEGGRVYKIGRLDVTAGQINSLEIERHGTGPSYPSYLLMAERATWTPDTGWILHDGALHILPDSMSDLAMSFGRLRDRRLRERPADLMLTPRSPDEMRYAELGRFIRAMERSGSDVRELKVEQSLKLAIPVTCIIIAVFGAPLATSTRRGGAAFGVGISLATTVIFLMLIQITKAVGGGGLLPPKLAAWVPNLLFGLAGLFLLSRTRT